MRGGLGPIGSKAQDENASRWRLRWMIPSERYCIYNLILVGWTSKFNVQDTLYGSLYESLICMGKICVGDLCGRFVWGKAI